MLFSTWLAFPVAAFLICLSPGPGAVASMSSGAKYGFRRGYWNVVGLQLGMLIAITITILGLGAIISTTPMLYEAVRWFGVAYLLYLGVMLWRVPKAADPDAEPDPVLPTPPQATRRALILRGTLVNISNPKGLVSMLAVLPQFMDSARPLLPQYLAITGTMVACDSSVMAVYTLLGARLLHVLQSPQQRLWIDRFFGTLFFAAALILALHHRQVG